MTGHDSGPHPVDLHVGRQVSIKRLALGYTQSDLGRALGLTFQQVQKYERGANRISASKLWDIARFLKVDVGYFYEGLTALRDDVGTPGHDEAEVPSTPLTREIHRLVPRLPLPKQRLALDLIREFSKLHV